MAHDVALRCQCGTIRGVAREVSGETGNRVVCYCDDCQSFAHFLARADEILDPHGGSDIYQMPAAHFEITGGSERIACMRLTAKGLLRWYAECCRTPIGNTVSSRQMPFVGVLHNFMDIGPQGVGDGESARNAVVGPIRARVQSRHARGELREVAAYDKFSAAIILRSIGIFLNWRLQGLHSPSPFFDSHSGKPIISPVVLSEKELSDIIDVRDR
jgi:hypothetical protein